MFLGLWAGKFRTFGNKIPAMVVRTTLNVSSRAFPVNFFSQKKYFFFLSFSVVEVKVSDFHQMFSGGSSNLHSTCLVNILRRKCFRKKNVFFSIVLRFVIDFQNFDQKFQYGFKNCIISVRVEFFFQEMVL